MIYLIPDTAAQTLRLTLDEGRAYFTDAFTHYLLVITREENHDGGATLAQVPVIVSDGERITVLTVTTVGLDWLGSFHYEVYGQNSAVNIDPLNASVVGLVEKGSGRLGNADGSPDYFTESSQTVPNDIVNE